MRDPRSVLPPYIPARPFVMDPPATELAWWLGNQGIKRAKNVHIRTATEIHTTTPTRFFSTWNTPRCGQAGSDHLS